ncbi:MAG: DUF4238 domain-containing protein [Chloroflexi bacterium]|nr:DUF4238 domain-containing protein [Chloroflexota bacterium]
MSFMPPSGKPAAFAFMLTLLVQSPENVALFVIAYGLADFRKDVAVFASASGIPEADLHEIADSAEQGQDENSPKRSDQHVVSRVVLRRFEHPTTNLIGNHSIQYGLRKPTGPGGLGWVKDFVKIDSTATEELWGTTESKLPDALAAADTQTLFDNAEHVATIKEAIALHYARSIDVLDQYEDLWQQVLAAKRAELYASPAATDAIYTLKTGDATGKPDDAMRESLAKEWLQRLTDIYETGVGFRFRVQHYFREATTMITSAGLEVLRPPSGSEFLIGDVPVITTDATGHVRGIAAGVPIGSAATVAMPLGPRLLVALGPKDLYAELDAKYVERLNAWQIEAAKRAVYFRPGSPCEPLAAQIRPPTGYRPPEPL